MASSGEQRRAAAACSPRKNWTLVHDGERLCMLRDDLLTWSHVLQPRPPMPQLKRQQFLWCHSSTSGEPISVQAIVASVADGRPTLSPAIVSAAILCGSVACHVERHVDNSGPSDVAVLLLFDLSRSETFLPVIQCLAASPSRSSLAADWVAIQMRRGRYRRRGQRATSRLGIAPS